MCFSSFISTEYFFCNPLETPGETISWLTYFTPNRLREALRESLRRSLLVALNSQAEKTGRFEIGGPGSGSIGQGGNSYVHGYKCGKTISGYSIFLTIAISIIIYLILPTYD